MRHAAKLFQVFERLHGGEYEGSGSASPSSAAPWRRTADASGPRAAPGRVRPSASRCPLRADAAGSGVMSPVTVDLRLRRSTTSSARRTSTRSPTGTRRTATRPRSSTCRPVSPTTQAPSTSRSSSGLPERSRAADTADRLRDAIVKYCDAHLVTVDRDSRRNNARGWLMLAFTVVVVAFFVWLAQRLSESSTQRCRSPLKDSASPRGCCSGIRWRRSCSTAGTSAWTGALLKTIRNKSTVRVEPLDRPGRRVSVDVARPEARCYSA